MVTQEMANKLLSDVNENSHFRLHMGTNISNIRQLAEALDIIAEDTFNHHVTATKNDFANWVKDTLGDEELVKSIESVKDRRKMARRVRERFDYLERKKTQSMVCNRDFLTCTAGDFALGAVIGFVIGMIMAAAI